MARKHVGQTQQWVICIARTGFSPAAWRFQVKSPQVYFLLVRRLAKAAAAGKPLRPGCEWGGIECKEGSVLMVFVIAVSDTLQRARF